MSRIFETLRKTHRYININRILSGILPQGINGTPVVRLIIF